MKTECIAFSKRSSSRCELHWGCQNQADTKIILQMDNVVTNNGNCDTDESCYPENKQSIKR